MSEAARYPRRIYPRDCGATVTSDEHNPHGNNLSPNSKSPSTHDYGETNTAKSAPSTE